MSAIEHTVCSVAGTSHAGTMLEIHHQHHGGLSPKFTKEKPMTKAELAMDALQYARHVRERLDKYMDEKRRKSSGWKR